MRIARDSYLKKLVDRQGNGLIKIVTGIRRCGKSYLLFEIFKEHLLKSGVPKDHIIEIKLDDRANKVLRDPDLCYSYVKERVSPCSVAEDNDQNCSDGQGVYYVLLDEVQLMPEFEDVLNGFLHFDNVDVYVTGSNSKFLSTDVITEFRGRGDEVRLHPLSFAEFFSVWDGDWESAWNAYYTYGGMPRIALMENDEDKIAYLNRLFSETYLRDIVERNGVKRPDELGEVVDFIASSVGSLTNPARLSAAFKSSKNVDISEATVANYLRYLEEAFLVSRAKRYDVRGRRAIGSPYKFYFEDVGLRNARLNFRQQEQTHIMENVIYNELVGRGFAVDVGVVETRKMENGVRSTRSTEIDFVANLGSKRYYIQSAYSLPTEEKRAQEVRSLNGTGDSFKKIVVVRDNVMLSRDEQGIVTMGLREFLLDKNSLDL